MIEQTALRYFLAVAKAKSIRKASDRLRISQSAVSRQMMLLEAELGVPLFKRLTQGVELTTAGEMFFRYASHTAKQVKRLKAEIRNTEDKRLHRIRIAATTSMTYHVLPLAVAQFRDIHPEVSFDMLVAAEADMFEWLAKKEIDIAITFRTVKTAVVREVFHHDLDIQAVARASHPLAQLVNVTTSDLATALLALPSPSLRIRQIIDDHAALEGVTLLPGFESNSTPLRLSLALGSDAVAMVLGGMSVLDDEYADLVPLCMKKAHLGALPIAAYVAAHAERSAILDTFLQMINETLRSCIDAGDEALSGRQAMLSARPC